MQRLLIIALVLAASVTVPTANANDELGLACEVVSNAHNIAGPLAPVSTTGGPACWLVRGITGPVGTETIPPPPDPSQAQHGATYCAMADATLDRAGPSTWYEFCGGAGSLRAVARSKYTQDPADCGASVCTYHPVFVVSLTEQAGNAEWVIRGSSYLRHYSNTGAGPVVAGSYREAECRVAAGATGCEASVANVEITAGNFNTFRYFAEYRVYLVDPTGAEHLQASGGESRYIAQYYQAH